MRTIQEKWESYRDGVLGTKTLPSELVEALRLSFYAGAGSTLAIVLRLPEEGLSDVAAGAVLNGLTTELRLHVAEVANRAIAGRLAEMQQEQQG